MVDAFYPCRFGGKNSSGVEIPDCDIDDGKLIDVMDGLRWDGKAGSVWKSVSWASILAVGGTT